jgi:hypothetical protein
MPLYPAGSVFSDSLFQDEVAQALASQQLAQNRLGEDQRLAEYEYGFTNKANPYSRYAQLNRQQGIEATDFTQGAAKGGQIRSGAYRIRQASLTHNQGAQQDQLRSQYDASILGYKRSGEDVTNTYNQALYNAGRGSLERKMNEPPPTPPEDAPPVADGAVTPGNPYAAFKPQKLKSMVSSTRRRKVSSGIAPVRWGATSRPGLPLLRPGKPKRRR